jgi:hypothetical protein
MEHSFKKWLEYQSVLDTHMPNGASSTPASNQVFIQGQPQIKERPEQTISTDTLLAVDEHVERLQQVITQLMFRRNLPGTDSIKNSWQQFLNDWGNLKSQLSHRNMGDSGLGSISVSPEREATLKSLQPPPTPNTIGWSASGGIGV